MNKEEGITISPRIIAHKIIRARKMHTCFKCGKLIRTSEDYVRIVFEYAGRISAIKIHTYIGCEWPNTLVEDLQRQVVQYSQKQRLSMSDM